MFVFCTLIARGYAIHSVFTQLFLFDLRNVNNDIMELLILAYACKTSSARKVIGVLPYLPYCKQSKMRKRGCIVSKLLAKMFTKAGEKLPRFRFQMQNEIKFTN